MSQVNDIKEMAKAGYRIKDAGMTEKPLAGLKFAIFRFGLETSGKTFRDEQ